MKGYIVYHDYFTRDEGTFVHLFGRLENGQSFVTENMVVPYFFIKQKEIGKIKKLLGKYEYVNVDVKDFGGDKLVKIYSNSSTELNKLYKAIHKNVDTFEADIRPHFRFMMDNDILGTIDIEGDYEVSERVDRVYREPKIIAVDYTPKLNVISIDTESGKKGLFCIGIYGDRYKKNFMITDREMKDVVSCKNEEECLSKFRDEIIKLDPDIITGWNIIDFDFVYLQELFRKNKIPFDLGRNNDNVRLRVQSGFFRSSSCNIPGRQVLDGMNLIRDPFISGSKVMRDKEIEGYNLESVSQGILGEGKLLKGKQRHLDIEELYRKGSKESLEKLRDYNIMDCKLVYDILKKIEVIDLAVERSKLTGMPLDRISGSIASFDSLFIREARKMGLASPTTQFGLKEERITGGYVFSSDPGIYHNVLILDFKSLYPSIIRTFNIDPSTYLEKKERGAIESPNKAYFKSEEGILPGIIEKLHNAREKMKTKGDEYGTYSIKIIMNSFFGVLASPNCRFFNMKMANAITFFGQFIIKLTAKEIEKLGYKVIYSDTDSIFVETCMGKVKANSLGLEIEKIINNFYRDYVKKNYNRESFLELEFEKQYISMMLPKIRGKGEGSAKKRYAGLLDQGGRDELEIIGLEAIRGDWTDAAGTFQKELLMRVFKKEEVSRFIRAFVKKIKEGKLDSELVYRKSIRKDLKEYTKTTPPHVKAARKMDKLDGNVIEYYITTDGPEPLQKLKHNIDYDHYIEKQIKPIANQVLELFDKDFDDVEAGSKQSKLF
jgi:DNA polymerase II